MPISSPPCAAIWLASAWKKDDEDFPANGWACGYAEAIRRTTSPETLGAKLDAHQLMDDATEIGSWVRGA